jgi:RNA polymerase sigma factor (TIGR02999 family)
MDMTVSWQVSGNRAGTIGPRQQEAEKGAERAHGRPGSLAARRTAPLFEPPMAPPDDTPPPAPAELPRGPAALDDVFPLVYEELRRVARRHLRGEHTGHTLDTTALVHEAWLELAKLEHVRWPGRAYVLAAASQAMRRILIDHAVARRAQKRGGGVVPEELDDAVAMAMQRGDELLALDEALERLGAANERCARVVECRFFGGMSVEETAEALQTSPATVKRDWTMARAWLNRELAQ